MDRAHHLSWKIVTWVSAFAIALMGLSPVALAYAVSPDQANEDTPASQTDGASETDSEANTGNAPGNASGSKNTGGTNGTNADNTSESGNGSSNDNAQGKSGLNSEESLVGEGSPNSEGGPTSEELLDEIAQNDISLNEAKTELGANASYAVIDHALDFTQTPEQGGWEADATLEEDGYSWDAKNLTLTLGDVEIGIHDPSKLVEKEQIPYPSGEVSPVLCAIVLPDGSNISTQASIMSDVWIDVDNPSATVATVYCEGDLFFSGSGTLWLQPITDGTQSSVGVYALGEDVTIRENTRTIIRALVDGTSQCNGIFGIYAPDANLYVRPNSSTAISAMSGDGTVETGICGACVNGFEIEGSKAKDTAGGMGYENIDTQFLAGASGEAKGGAIGLLLSGNDPDNTVLGIYGATRVWFIGDDVALASDNWDEDLGYSTYKYAFGYDETNPFVGFGTNDLNTAAGSLAPDGDVIPVIYLAGKFADNEYGELGYRYVTFEPVSLKKVSVSPATATLAPGGSQTFAVYAETNYPESFPVDQDISSFTGAKWSVGDNLSSNTVMDGATLKVAADETAQTVTVTPSPSSTWDKWFSYISWDPSSAVVTIDQSQVPQPQDPGADGTSGSATNGAESGPDTGALAATGDHAPFVMGVTLILALVAAGLVVFARLRLRRN